MLALTLGLAAQSSAQSAAQSAAQSVASVPAGPWKLIELHGRPLVLAAGEERRRPDLEFSAPTSRAFGQSGCNRYHGGYTLDDKGLRFHNMASTMMACPEPLMELEQRYLRLLGQARGFRIEQGRLLLLGEDGSPLAVFEPR